MKRSKKGLPKKSFEASLLEQLIASREGQTSLVGSLIKDSKDAVSLIDTLGERGLWNESLINALRELFPQKEVIKAIKRLVYVLSQKGVKVEPTWKAEGTQGPLGLVGPPPLGKVMSSMPFPMEGWRELLMGLPNRSAVLVHLSPFMGLEVKGYFRPKDVTKVFSDMKEVLYEIPAEYACFLIKKAFEYMDPTYLNKPGPLKDLYETVKNRPVIDLDDLMSTLRPEGFDVSPEEIEEGNLFDILREMIKSSGLFEKYESLYKAAIKPDIIVSSYVIEQRKEDVFNNFLGEFLSSENRDKIKFILKESVLMEYLKNRRFNPEISYIASNISAPEISSKFRSIVSKVFSLYIENQAEEKKTVEPSIISQ